MATDTEKGLFKLNIAGCLSDYTTKLAKKERLGIERVEYKFRAFLLTAFYEILLDYLEPADSLDDNFFTAAEARDILEHFNRICDSTITYIDFE